MHPSGLLALSTARDDMLRMWNMAKGRSQYKTKIPPGTEAVRFSPDAAMYALLSGTKVCSLFAIPSLASPCCCLILRLKPRLAQRLSAAALPRPCTPCSAVIADVQAAQHACLIHSQIADLNRLTQLSHSAPPGETSAMLIMS